MTATTTTATDAPASSSFTQTVRSLTAQQILDQFDELTPLDSKPTSKGSTADESIFAGHDAEQVRLMEEVCIVLDYDDKPVAAGSKKTCELNVTGPFSSPGTFSSVASCFFICRSNESYFLFT